MRIGWLLVAALAVGGYVSIVAPAGRQAIAIGLRARELDRLAARNERLLADAAGLRAAHRRVAADVARLSGPSRPALAVVAMLRLLEREGRRRRVLITSLSPGERGNAAVENGAEDVTVGLRGGYASVLQTVADLTKGDILIQVRDLDLAQASDDTAERNVDATVRATLYHRLSAIMKEERHAQNDAR
ncbi:MAG TPA: hypothetical protein VIJ77_10135 [Candidatus Tumulicola sp.]